MNTKQLHQRLVKEIEAYFDKNGFEKAVIGLSGGIDSSLSAKLVADAIGKENAHGIIMPVKGLSSEENAKDTVKLCELIGISHSLIYINEFLKPFEKFPWQNKIAKMTTASRIRAVILYNYANSHNALVIGTSNKTEMMLGYFTKYGDGAVDIEVIGDLFKTDEYALAEFLGLPEKIIKKVPTAELYHGQTDEDELGAPYSEIDKILRKIAKKEKVDSKGALAQKILKRMKANEHKGKLPHLVRVF